MRIRRYRGRNRQNRGCNNMARPKKWRKVCNLPLSSVYGPLNGDIEDTVVMTVDEYETIRLIDLERLKQEECAIRMNIARTTVQGIYNSARIKLADSLINCKKLKIEGGEYRLCDENDYCGMNGCGRHRHGGGRNKRRRQ